MHTSNMHKMKQATTTNEKGECTVSGLRGKVEIVSAKIPGTTLEMARDGTATLRLPEGTLPGEGGGVVLKDDDGEFRVSVVIPGGEP